MELPILQGRRVLLRAAEERDIEARRRAARDLDWVRGFGGEDTEVGEVTAASAERWFQWITTSAPGWVIEHDGHAIGTAWLGRHKHSSRTARFSIGIWRADLRGKGLGAEATGLVLGHAFGPAGLHRVELTVFAGNSAAVRCYEKCGFVVEGRSREVIFRDGRWEDDLEMAILEHEFGP